MTEIPPDITIEPVWLIEATCASDAAEARRPFRAEHLARIADLRDAGIIIEAGGTVDVTSSVILARAADERAALDIARADVYLANGIWVEVRARPFGRVLRSAGAAAAGS